MDITKIKEEAIVSGVSKTLYKEYKFEDHIWKSNPSILLPPNYYAMFGKKMFDGLLEFAKICVYMKTKYYVFFDDRGWVKYDNKGVVKKAVLNSFRGKNFAGWAFDDAFNDAFFDGSVTLMLPAGTSGKPESGTFSIGSCPDFDGYMSLPLCPRFIIVNGKKFVNTWKASKLLPNTDFTNYGSELLWLVYRSLCSGAELDEDKTKERELVLQGVMDGTYCNNPTFKWVIMWLAAQIQKPGINLLSNLWLLGELQGVGKGTLVQVMNLIIGRHNIAKLNQTEIEAGWSDHLLGASLVEIDELDPGAGKLAEKPALKFWATWIKANTSSEFSNFLERNVGKHEDIINTSNFIFTTNNETPVAVESTDRRNCFVKTTSEPEFVHHAAAFQEAIFKDHPYDVAQGFMAIMLRVKVELSYINTIFTTDIKAEIIDATKPVVEQWIESDPTFAFGLHNSSALYEKFMLWCKACNESFMTQTAFGLKIKRLNPRFYKVTKNRCPTTRRFQYSIIDISSMDTNLKKRDSYIKELAAAHNKKDNRVEGLDVETEHKMSIASKKSIEHMRATLKQMVVEKTAE